MNIGIVSTWFERGAAYVSKIYEKLLEKEGHKVFIFARGGENPPSSKSSEWNGKNVTRSTLYVDSTVEKPKMKKWIRKNDIEAILFNEQRNVDVLIWLKRVFPNVKLGAYVDYYTEDTLPWFDLYDFLICNTKRHFQTMENHPQKYYLRWGTDVNLYTPSKERHEQLTFFHSVGMSARKGTDILLNAFIKGGIYKKSKLVIHTQIPIEEVTQYTKEELKKYNIDVIEKTVTAPGLYYMGDVYVYPTKLDGLGLTMYEALASGLPMITSDFPPMNEVGTEDFVKRVKIADYYCRQDAYYYPMVLCDETSLIEALKWYVDHPEELDKQKKMARKYAEENYDIWKQSKTVSDIFVNSKLRPLDKNLVKRIKRKEARGFNFVDWLLKFRFICNIIEIKK